MADMTTDAFALLEPLHQTTPVIFASPHSGCAYPADFVRASVLDHRTLRSSEDAFVDDLFDAAPEHGAPFLKAVWPRAFVDLNRNKDEMDPAVVTGVRRLVANPRIASGLGVIPRVVANGRAIYSGKIPLAQAQERIDRCWTPYHTRLQTLITDTQAQFGQSVLIDCHSMPQEALDQVRINGKRPDIVLGDRFGAAAAPEVQAHVQAAFANAGLVVSRNVPFAGAYIVQRYGRPARGQHVVQVEINRALYMDEGRVERSDGFAALKATLTDVIARLVRFGADQRSLAAE